MGHKKRNPALRPKQSQSASPEAAAEQVAAAGGTAANGHSPAAEPEPRRSAETPNSIAQSKIESWPSAELEDGGSASYNTVKLECERALTALRRGNHTKALRLMKESCQRHENSPHSALVHRVQGTVCVKVAAIIDDTTAKNRHLRNAVDAARRAVELSPNSIEFAHFYANLLYDVANEAKEYEEAVRECERALAIENPIDPAKESLQDESQLKSSTVEARIVQVQGELRQLIQKSNIASISSWVKNLGNGDEKFRLIPIRRVPEDPMEVRLVQARRPNEIKKATKTPEERRKEIEVRVAAARLLQRKSEVPQLENGGVDKGLDSSPVSGQRVGERRKSRKNGSSSERRDFVRSFWNSTSVDTKRELLRIRVSDIKEHFGSLKDGLAHEVLSEALLLAENNRTWKLWDCCKCNDRFTDSESYTHHVVQEHIGSLLPKMQAVLPQNVDNEWIDMLLNCSWKPLDVSAAVKMIGNQTKCKDSEFVDDVCLDNQAGDFDDCVKDTWDSSPEKEQLMDGCGGRTVESTNRGQIPSIESRESDEDNRSMAYFSLNDKWPVSDDTECAMLLEKIHAAFEVLVRHKCLAESHLNRVIQFTMDELQRIAAGSQLLNHGVEQTPMCICFLGASQLKKILKYLQDLSQSCGLGRYPEKSSCLVDGANNGSQIKDRVVLNGDASFLLLDESLLSAESTKDNAAAATSAVDTNATGDLTDSNALLSWIFAGPTSGEELASWVRAKEEKAREGVEILQMLEKEFYQLQNLCEQKCEHLGYEEALQAVEDLCVEEGKKRENAREFLHQSFESVLKKRRDELLESENDVMFLSTRIELDAISNVLKEAESLGVNQFGYEETYGSASSQFPDLEAGEDDDWRAKDYLQQVDSCVEHAIHRQKEQLYEELSKVDARIMHSVAGMQQLEAKVEPAAARDFRSILLPLVKSYLRAHLEDLAEKDATEKSVAMSEALLAELALDSKKAVKGGNDHSRNSQEKTKDKRKNKESRKAKDSKIVGVSEPQMVHDETDESDSFPSARDGDHPDIEIVGSVNNDKLRQQEEELRRRIELEAEERKLEETLEFQRRIENEAKQKHLAEQQKKATQAYPEKVADGMHDGYLESSPVDSGVRKQSKPSVQNLAKNLEGLQVGKPAHFAPRIKFGSVSATQTTSNEHQANALQGLPNGGISDGFYLPSDRRAGKRGRRQKNSAKVADGKHQVLSSRESVEVGSSRADSDSKKEVNPVFLDNGAKTLRQRHLDEDDEERFQADLKNAMRQSLDTFQAHKKLPSVSNLKTPPRVSGKVDNSSAVPSDVQMDNMNGGDVFGTGLKNEVGEYNCFLNVIIQSLWHIRRFRDEFLQRLSSVHVHVGDPCVVCALHEIFSALSIASTATRREAVAPSSLRIALSNLYPDSNFFKEGQMNDASEVLGVIFDCLHRSFTLGSSVSDTESESSSCLGSWDCANNACIAHSIFGMDIFERMNCYSCALESRHLKYTSFFHNINASALRMMKVMCSESSFDELLNLVEMNHQLACDPDSGGCGKLNHIHHILSSLPHVFTTVVGWQNTSESIEDITATLGALDNEIDISVLYRGLDPTRHKLVSVVCYYGQHYHCFAYSHDHGRWIMYDDNTVRVVGSWTDVLHSCERGHLQPQVLFFEAAN